MISLKQIQYALAIEKTLHFKKAADVCNVSQSTLSSAINELEKQLGVQLFERNNKQVLITVEGHEILRRAKIIKTELDEIMQLSQRDSQPLSGSMTLGVIPTIGPYLLPKVLPKIRHDFPNFKLSIIEEQSHTLVERVRAGEIDAAILAMPFDISGLIKFDFWEEDFYWVAHKDESPKNRHEVRSSELDANKLMLLRDGHCLKRHTLAACQLQDTKKDSSFEGTSLYTLIQMVLGKLGSTIVPQMALDQLLGQETELRAIHLNEPGPHRTISLVIRPHYVRTNEVVLLKDIFSQQLKLKCQNTET